MNSIEDLHALGNLLTGFVSNKDFKRKHEESEFLSPSPKKPRTVHALDYSAFLTRVSTFKDISWCHSSCSSITSPLSPLQLARHGWTGVEGEGRLARCISCRENLYLVLPPVTSTTFASTLEKQSSRVVAGHAEFCPWGASPSPHSWASVSSTKQDVVVMARSLVVCGTDLPWVKEETVEKFSCGVEWVVREMGKGGTKKQDKRGKKKSKDVEQKAKVKQTAALLALLGWQSGELEKTMTDIYRVRRVGFWNFVSIQEEMDKAEDLKVARELSGKREGKQEDKEVGGKKCFDPIREHLSWNPIAVTDESGLMGWEIVRDIFVGEEGVQVNVGERRKSEAIIEGEGETGNSEKDGRSDGGEALGVLQRVRSLLDLW